MEQVSDVLPILTNPFIFYTRMHIFFSNTFFEKKYTKNYNIFLLHRVFLYKFVDEDGLLVMIVIQFSQQVHKMNLLFDHHLFRNMYHRYSCRIQRNPDDLKEVIDFQFQVLFHNIKLLLNNH